MVGSTIIAFGGFDGQYYNDINYLDITKFEVFIDFLNGNIMSDSLFYINQNSLINLFPMTYKVIILDSFKE